MVGYPFSYGEIISENENNKRFSCHVLSLLKNKRFQRHCSSVVWAGVFLILNAPGASASDMPGAEYEKIMNQAAEQNPGGVPQPPLQPQPQAQLNNPEAPYILKAMPIEMQQKIAAQHPNGMYNPVAVPGPEGLAPTTPPSFYIPGKPRDIGPRALNTVMFGTSLGIICLNALWGEPVAIVMCTTGLTTMTIKIVKKLLVI